jgi:hypothetical protein
MEGLSKITYKNKTILYIDYSKVLGSKEKILQLIEKASQEYLKYPPKSALALTNFSNIQMDSDIVQMLKKTQEKTFLYEKKVTLIGNKDHLKVGYNFIVGFTQRSIVQMFDTELEAKEWLVKD